jgi:hypothetical protein
VPFVASAAVALVSGAAIAFATMRTSARSSTPPAPPAPIQTVAIDAAGSASADPPGPSPTAAPDAEAERLGTAPEAAPAGRVAPAPKLRSGSFYLEKGIGEIPHHESEAWRVRTNSNIDACLSRHGDGACDLRFLALVYHLDRWGEVKGSAPVSYGADDESCELPADLVECLARAPDANVSPPKFSKADTAFVQRTHRCTRVP